VAGCPQVNVAYLCILYGILMVAVVIFLTCVYAFVKSPRPATLKPHLRGWLPPLVFAITTCLGMVCMLTSKEVVATTAVQVRPPSPKDHHPAPTPPAHALCVLQSGVATLTLK
jgi:hypothetical protein